MAVTVIATAVTMSSCSQSKTSEQAVAATEEKYTIASEECDMTVGNVHFTQSLNGAAQQTEILGADSTMMRSEAKKDFFIDPNGKDVMLASPILLTEVDNTKPFTLTTHLAPGFTPDGTYTAGCLYVYVSPERWLKMAFEQDERGGHRVVTVRTEGTSDDNNHDLLTAGDVSFKISSDTNVIGFYYSVDGQQWQLVRLFRNAYPEKLHLGISAQCPGEGGSQTLFTGTSITTEAVKSFRLGE